MTDVEMDTVPAETEVEQMEEADVPREPVNLSLMTIIKHSQQQHGLRRGDYLRYRQYCSRRLRRLRTSLRMTCGKPGRFQSRKVNEDQCSGEPRFLLVPLVNAERAWAHAMQIKEEIAAGSEHHEARRHNHVVRKFRKALQWAEEIARLCSLVGNKRTQLESEAYRAMMYAHLNLEIESYTTALESYIRARVIFGELARVADGDSQNLYRERVTEIDPSIRFCQYHITRSGDDAVDIDALMSKHMQDAGMRDQIESVLEDSRRAQAEARADVVSWQGVDIPISNIRVREMLLVIDDTVFELERARPQFIGGSEEDREKVMDLYDRLLMTCSDAQMVAQRDRDAAERAEDLQNYFTWRSQSAALERHLLLVKWHQKRFNSGDATVTAGDIVRLFDNVLQTFADIAELSSEDQAGINAAREQTWKAQRCYWVSKSNTQNRKWAEAAALLGKAEELVRAAQASYESFHDSPFFKEDMDTLLNLFNIIRVDHAALRGLAALQDEELTEDLAENLSLADRSDGFATDKPDSYPRAWPKTSQAVSERITRFPPGFQAMPVKPLFFDLAFDAVAFPDLSERKKKLKEDASWLGGVTSKISGLGGWLGRKN